MAISIREATNKDFDSVYGFVCELQNKTFDRKLLEQLYDLNVTNEDNIYLVALDGASPIGYASCHLQTLLHHAGKVAEVQEMFVVPNYRSKGVGKLLMDRVKTVSKTKGAVQLEVTTRAIREGAIQFYKRESFEDSHKKLIYYFG